MSELKQEQPTGMPNEILLRVIQINESIVRQNALLIQTLTLPSLVVSGEKPGSWTEYPKEKNNG